MVNFTKVDPTDLDESDLDEINEALGADDADDGVNNPGSAAAQHVSDLANLIIEANPNLERSDALHWLISTAPGRTLVLRTLQKRQQKRKTKMQNFNRADELLKIAKDFGLEKKDVQGHHRRHSHQRRNLRA